MFTCRECGNSEQFRILVKARIACGADLNCDGDIERLYDPEVTKDSEFLDNGELELQDVRQCLRCDSANIAFKDEEI